MTLELKPGLRLRSAVCTTEVIVVRAPSTPVVVECGGAAMIAMGDEPISGAGIDLDFAEGTELGKRYAVGDLGLELLCTKPGDGSLSIGGVVLVVKDAKPLPSSD